MTDQIQKEKANKEEAYANSLGRIVKYEKVCGRDTGMLVFPGSFPYLILFQCFLHFFILIGFAFRFRQRNKYIFYLTSEAKYFARKNINFFCACSVIFRHFAWNSLWNQRFISPHISNNFFLPWGKLPSLFWTFIKSHGLVLFSFKNSIFEPLIWSNPRTHLILFPLGTESF